VLPKARPVIAEDIPSFAGNVLKLVSGTTIAQAVGILITPLLTRLYAPEAFGILALFTSITSILGVIACMRYELAIMLPKSDEEAANLLAVSLGFALALSLLTVPVVWFAQDPLLRLLRTLDLAPYLWLVPPMVLVSGVFLALSYWSSRTKRFGLLSIARVAGTVGTHSLKLGAGYTGYATGGSLIGATVVGQAAATTMLAGRIWWENRHTFRQSINIPRLLRGIKLYHRFPLYSSWSALINTVSWQLPTILLATYFSPTVVGYYSLGFRVLQMPMSLIGSAIGQVFFQRAAQAKLEGTLTESVEKVSQSLIRICVIPILLLTVLGKELFIVVLGTEWAEAGVYAQILSIWIIFWFVSSPLSIVIIVLEKQDLEFRLSIMSVLMRLSALTIGGLTSSARLSISLFAFSGVLVYGYLCFLVTTLAGIAWKHTARAFVREFRLFIPFGVILVTLQLTIGTPWIRLIAGALVLAWHLVKLATDMEIRASLRSVQQLSASSVDV